MPVEHTSSVYPWGAECAAISAPMMPPAPPRLSATTCYPSSSPSRSVSTRARLSTDVPVVLAMIMRIGFDGYDAADSAATAAPHWRDAYTVTASDRARTERVVRVVS